MTTPENNPEDNPKHAAGKAKASTACIPPAPLVLLGRVMEIGADKYGRFNWGEAGVVASVYKEAIERHLWAWYTGEDRDPESQVSHLAHVMACCSILIDCALMGVLDDDRPTGKTGNAAEAIDTIAGIKAKKNAGIGGGPLGFWNNPDSDDGKIYPEMYPKIDMEGENNGRLDG